MLSPIEILKANITCTKLSKMFVHIDMAWLYIWSVVIGDSWANKDNFYWSLSCVMIDRQG